MTSTIDAPAGVEVEAEEAVTTESAKRGRKSDRDFSQGKVVQRHQDLADFINAHPAYQASGLPQITPEVVKAVQLLAEDFRNTPEQVEARKAREAERKQEEKEFQGLSADEKKELKAANRKAKQLAEVQERREALLAKAKAIREAAEASGEDLSAVESESEDSGKRGRRIRRS
jgi:hypothetical protein